MRPRACALALTSLLLGCHATETQPSTPPASTVTANGLETEPDVGWALTNYAALKARALAYLDTPDGLGRRPEYVQWGLARGERLEAFLLATRSVAPPSRRPADEAL